MNLLQLSYILEVAKVGSLLKASKNLHISQPALSKAITSLEKELGTKIFKRSRLGTTPTIQGEKILEIAYDIITKSEKIKRITTIHTEETSDKLVISTSQSSMTFLINPLINTKNKYPNMDIKIREKGTNEVLEDIYNNEVDIGICRMPRDLPEKYNNIMFEQLLVAKLNVLVSKNSPLSFNRIITPSELKKHPIVLHTSEVFKWLSEDFNQRYGDFNILFTSNNRTIIRRAVRSGLAITFSFDFLTDVDDIDPELVSLNLSYDRPLSFSIGIAYLKDLPFHPGIEYFIKELYTEVKSKGK